MKFVSPMAADSSTRFFMPDAASTVAGQVDSLYYFIHWVSVVCFVLIVALLVVFVIKYHRRSEAETTPNISHNTWLEVTWILIPLLVMLIIFAWGFGTFMDMAVAPGDSMNIYVTAQRWSWSFEYPGGATSTGELVVPLGQPVKLIMTSKDLIHSFYVPQFRVKQDVIPSRYTTTWFQATKLGIFDLYCTEYCGTSHSDMTARVRVVAPEDYQKWLETGGIDPSKLTLAQFGAALFKAKACATCHTVDGMPKVGPSFKGIYGQPARLSDGKEVMVDEEYIRESLMVPGAKIVFGFPNQMPSYQGLLKDKEITALIEYIKSLGAEKNQSSAEPAKGK